MNLYQIASTYRELMVRIDSLDGELPEDFEVQLAAVEAELPTKVDAYCSLRREYQADANAAREEAKRLLALAQVRDNAADRLWKAVTLELGDMGMQKYETTRFKLWSQRNPPSAKFDGDPATLPPECQRVKVEPDKTALIDLWKDGKVLPPGVSVEQSVGWRMK